MDILSITATSTVGERADFISFRPQSNSIQLMLLKGQTSFFSFNLLHKTLPDFTAKHLVLRIHHASVGYIVWFVKSYIVLSFDNLTVNTYNY